MFLRSSDQSPRNVRAACRRPCPRPGLREGAPDEPGAGVRRRGMATHNNRRRSSLSPWARAGRRSCNSGTFWISETDSATNRESITILPEIELPAAFVTRLLSENALPHNPAQSRATQRSNTMDAAVVKKSARTSKASSVFPEATQSRKVIFFSWSVGAFGSRSTPARGGVPPVEADHGKWPVSRKKD